MKYEWKKHDKRLYGAAASPSFLDVPTQSFIMIQGAGNPNDADFSNRVSALFALAYAIKMAYKSAAIHNTISAQVDDFTVYPLEGVWTQKEGHALTANGTLIKENLEYTIMIRQPDFITKELVLDALERVARKKPNPLYQEIFFDAIPGGTYVEILHTGSYDHEPASFAKMDEYIQKNGLQRTSRRHREIYLNNAGRVGVDKLKTILRYGVTKQ